MDDGSRDNTKAIVESHQDSRIRYLPLEKNQGASKARNLGLQEARGQYIAFLDSDDEWLPQKLERQINALSSSDLADVGIVICGTNEFDVDGIPQVFPAGLRGHIYENVLTFRNLGHMASGSCMMIHRKVLEKGLSFDETLPAHQTWDFLLRVCRTFQVEIVRESLVNYYRDRTDHLYVLPNIIKAREIILQKYREEFRSRPSFYRKLHVELCFMCHLNRQKSRSTWHARKAVAIRPLDIRSYFWLCASLLAPTAFIALLRLSGRSVYFEPYDFGTACGP